jgi:hypothetical protein
VKINGGRRMKREGLGTERERERERSRLGSSRERLMREMRGKKKTNVEERE